MAETCRRRQNNAWWSKCFVRSDSTNIYRSRSVETRTLLTRKAQLKCVCYSCFKFNLSSNITLAPSSIKSSNITHASSSVYAPISCLFQVQFKLQYHAYFKFNLSSNIALAWSSVYAPISRFLQVQLELKYHACFKFNKAPISRMLPV